MVEVDVGKVERSTIIISYMRRGSAVAWPLYSDDMLASYNSKKHDWSKFN